MHKLDGNIKVDLKKNSYRKEVSGFTRLKLGTSDSHFDHGNVPGVQ
jgi:hypothetical protein